MSINEELSFTEYTLTEDTTDFIISFDRIGGSTDEVSILVNNTPIEDLVGYTVTQVNFSTWRVDPALPAGTVVRLARTTNLDKMVYVFTAGAKFIAKNVDSNFKQIQHSQQEIRDRQDKLERDATSLLLEINDVKIIAEQAAVDANEALVKVDDILNTGVVPAGTILTNSGQNQQQVNDFGGAKWYAKVGGYDLGAAVKLDSGDVIASTISSNTNNPNVDMTGWVFLNNRFTVQSVAELRNVRNPTNRMEVSVNAYTTGSGIGGGVFYADADDTTSIDNGVTIFVGVDGTRWKRKNSILNFAMAGCTGSGDETVALTRLFSLLAATGGTVIDLSGMKISFSSNITCTAPNKKIVLHGNVGLYSDTASISISGEIAEIGVISANASAGSMSVSVSAVGDIAVGDVVALHNTRLKSFAAHRDYYTDGEFKTVKSVSSNVLNFNQQLETSYSTADTNKVYKISPVILDIDGLVVTGNGVSALDVSLSYKSKFNFNANNLLNTANSQRAFMLDRSYDCEIIGGRYVKLGVSGTGTDYGIVFANCQDIRNNAQYCYGGRHAVATGGTALPASVPTRRVNTIYSELVNDPASDQHVADFHGNTADSYFSNCTIHGRVALGGFNTKSTQNTILMQPADIRPPVGLGEVVGGEIVSIGDKVVASGSSQYITTFLTSSNALLVTKPAVIKIQDITFNGSSSLVGILATTNLPVTSRWILDGFELVGSAPTFNRLVNYLAGSATVKPDYFQITRPKYPVPESMIILNGDGGLAGITKQAFPQSGSNANGKWSRQEDGGQICRHKITTTTPITTATTGGFRSPDILWTYPKGFVVEAPTIVAMSLDASLSIGATNPTTASASMYVLSPSSIASASVSFDVLAIGRHLF